MTEEIKETGVEEAGKAGEEEEEGEKEEGTPETKQEQGEEAAKSLEKEGEEGKQEEGEPDKENKLENKLEENGFDYAALEQEYIDNGDLTKETREKLNKIGFSDEFINDFINGKKALYEQEINEMAASIGGREAYNTVIEWAGNNLDAQTIQAVNSVRDKTLIKDFILPILKQKMDEKEGVIPQTIIQGSANPPAEDLFESQEEMYAAIRDERYRKDPAYMKKVTRKIRASREAGIDLGI